MTQLPSVSELLIGAQTAKPDTTLQMGVQSVNSGTSPRQIQTQARHDISHALGYLAGPPTKLPRVEPTSHVYTETMAAERLSGSYQGGHQSTHQNSHESSHQSSSSSARNSVTSVTSEGQPQVAHLPSTSDFHNQHKGATRSNNTSSSPQLHYRQRHEPSANIDALSDSVPHASLTQNIPSPDIVSRQREPVTEKRGEPQPYDRSTTTAREHSLGGRPRPASFSFAAGPPPMSAPSVPLYAPMKQSYGHMPNPNPHPDLQPIQGYASAHYHAPPIGPMTFYNAPTAGSGYVHNYYSTPPGQYSVAVPGPVPGMHHGSFHSAYPGTYPGMVPGTYPGAVAGPGYIKHGPYMTPEAALPGNYGHDYYAPAQYRQGQMPVTPYSQVDAMIRQPQHHLPVPDGPPEDLASLSSDPNHALINKRCIIKRRTRTGCLTCRKRRIKCDERKPHCFNCERSKKICLGYEISTNSNSTMTYTLEMKQQNNSSSESLHDNEQSQVKTEKPPVERQRSSVHDLL